MRAILAVMILLLALGASPSGVLAAEPCPDAGMSDCGCSPPGAADCASACLLGSGAISTAMVAVSIGPLGRSVPAQPCAGFSSRAGPPGLQPPR